MAGFRGNNGGMQNLMMQAKKMQEEMEKTAALLDDWEIVGTAAGEAVVVYMNAKKIINGIELDESVVDPTDVEMLEDLTQGNSRYNFQKIYARREVQGRGVGRYMIEQGIEWVRRCEERLQPEPHDITIELFVNRRNKAVDFYRYMGFEIVDTRDHAIGNDFYMNDYIMQRIIQL